MPAGAGRTSILSRQRIVDAALALARSDGMAGVSMRRLGRELGVQPMSLYHHVPSRAALMVLMADNTVARLPEPDPTLPWNRRLADLMVHIFRLGVEDPAVLPVLAAESSSPGTCPPPRAGRNSPPAASEKLIEAVLGLLAEAGVPAAERQRACRGLMVLVVGFLAGHGESFRMQGAGVGSREADRCRSADDGVEGLRFGVDLIIDGLRFRKWGHNERQ